MRSTAAWQRDAREAARDARAAATGVHPGKKVFDETCAGCHGVDRTIVGPPLIEIVIVTLPGTACGPPDRPKPTESAHRGRHQWRRFE